jgi:hypothetical protein
VAEGKKRRKQQLNKQVAKVIVKKREHEEGNDTQIKNRVSIQLQQIVCAAS